MDIERGDDDAIDAATATVRGWLSRERETSEASSEFSAGRRDSDGGDARDGANEGDDAAGRRAAADAGSDEAEDEDGASPMGRRQGA